MSRDIAASARARLKTHADEHGEDFNLTLTRYGLERLLYRLSVSRHADAFLLKGALLFSLWYGFPHRPTRDADLLGFGASDVDSLTRVFQEICSLAAHDGVVFDVAGIRAAAIRKTTDYGGVRIDVPAALGAARMALQVDVGFGDAVTPAAQEVRYPVLLEDMPAPRLRAYSRYTVIAEKLHAICLLGVANTRLKDYFDLHILLQREALDPEELARATAATFRRRGMPIPSTVPVGLSDGFGQDARTQAQWKAFLKKNKLDQLDLARVIAGIRETFSVMQWGRTDNPA